MLDLLLRGLFPPVLSIALIIVGVQIGSVYAWVPIGSTVAVLSAIFFLRVRKLEIEEIRLMLHPAKIRPVEEVLDECEFLKKHGDSAE